MEIHDIETAQKVVDEKVKDAAKNKKKARSKAIGTVVISFAIVILVIILAFLINGIIKGNKGKNISEDLKNDLGKSIAMAQKNTGIEFETTSEYAVLDDIVDYNYIYEADTTVKVCGIKLPQWVVFVKIDGNDKISEVVYYDFRVLGKNWKGEKTNGFINTNEVTYNMPKKEAERIITVSPLAVTYSNDDTSTYLYKYYYVDETDDNTERAYYVSVTYNMDDIIRGVSSKESDYVSFIFK